MKVLVLGATGMLGHKLFQVLRDRFPDTFCAVRGLKDDERLKRIVLFQSGNVIEGVNAEDLPALRKMLVSYQPQVVINCVGIVKQRPEATAAISSMILNA